MALKNVNEISCHTQEEIAGECGMSQQRIAEILPDLETLPIPVKYLFQDDFEPPLYNERTPLC
jgi:hypothetical protein